LGEYLQSDFDPTSLTVSQLLGVLGYHNVAYPTPYSKSKLVQLFQREIKAKAAELGKERLKKTNSIPSDDGITDGLTGELITKVRYSVNEYSREALISCGRHLHDGHRGGSPRFCLQLQMKRHLQSDSKRWVKCFVSEDLNKLDLSRENDVDHRRNPLSEEPLLDERMPSGLMPYAKVNPKPRNDQSKKSAELEKQYEKLNF
jgi:hypothetical protein